jgi:hypothetical protein
MQTFRFGVSPALGAYGDELRERCRVAIVGFSSGSLAELDRGATCALEVHGLAMPA